jgi:hypothetical protein
MLVSMMTSPDVVTRKLMKQFETKQARNCDIEYKQREPDCTSGFPNWAPTFEQIGFSPDVRTHSVFPRAFKAHQKGQISFRVHNGEQFLMHGIAERFSGSKISKPSLW